MKIVKSLKNNELLTFTKYNKIKISIDDNYDECNIKKGYKINLIIRNKGSYKGSFMNNYICKKFISNQKVDLTNIETNKLLNYCKYFLLSENEYIKYFPRYKRYNYYWLLRSPLYSYTFAFTGVGYNGGANNDNACWSGGFVPFFIRKKVKK